MTTPNEARAWHSAHSAHPFPFGSDAEYTAAITATTSDHGVTTYGDTDYSPEAMVRRAAESRTLDAMLTREDATAERGSTTERIIGAVASVLVGAGFIALVALTLWGWLS